MATSSLIFCSLLALLCGFLAQQTIEALMNTALTLLPFNLKTVK